MTSPFTIDGEPVTPVQMAARAGLSTCCLCSDPMEFVGVHLSNRDHYEELVAATMARGMALPSEDKERVVVFGLCRSCYARPDRDEAVEERIFAPVRG